MERKTIDIEMLVRLHSEGKTDKTIADIMGVSGSLIKDRREKLKLPRNNYTFTQEIKNIISEKRKLWLSQNPDKHPWKRKGKYQSVPCENVKNILKNAGIDNFVEEYNPNIKDRHFSVDIAFPDKMIALEINGNQHYDNTGNLKPYYQERHNILIRHGWEVYEIHYSLCFNSDNWKFYIKQIMDKAVVCEFNYQRHKKMEPVPRIPCCCGKDKRPNASKCPECRSIKKQSIKNKEIYLCQCGNERFKQAKGCMECYLKEKNSKCKRPERETLSQLLQTKPMTGIGKIYGVSDNAVRKWAKYYELDFHQKPRRVTAENLN